HTPRPDPPPDRHRRSPPQGDAVRHRRRHPRWPVVPGGRGLPAHLDGRQGRRLGRHPPAGQGRRDQCTLVQRPEADGRLGRRDPRRRRRAALRTPRRAGPTIVQCAVLVRRRGLSLRRGRRCERRRPGVPPQPTLRRLAAAPGARPRAVGSRGRGRAQAVADPRRPPLARPRSPRLQGPLLRRPPRPRRGLSPGHGLGLAHRPVHRRLAEGPPQRPRRRPPLSRRFRAPPQRGGPRHHQRDLRRRASIYPARLHCPGLERRRGAPLLDENLGLSQTWSRVSKAALPSPMDKNQREAGDRRSLEGAPTRFETCRDVAFGGVLCALPALAANGLFRHVHDCLAQLRGYYSTLHVIVLLAHMALCRIKTVEQRQYQPPGELGKLLGLDRVPEVRCLRRKLAALSLADGPKKWAGLLSRDWLEAAPELSGVLYVDGHVRLYHGSQTALPRRYASRQRLCLRGTTDYWVNDVLGQPFFAVERPINHGLLEALRSDIVPRLLKDVPDQSTAEELEADRSRARLVILFDREGYSPEFSKEMSQTHRIACITYHKYPKDDWPVAEFAEIETTLRGGEQVSLQLAERGSWIGDRKNGLWVREVRKLTTSGHQVQSPASRLGFAVGVVAGSNVEPCCATWK